MCLLWEIEVHSASKQHSAGRARFASRVWGFTGFLESSSHVGVITGFGKVNYKNHQNLTILNFLDFFMDFSWIFGVSEGYLPCLRAAQGELCDATRRVWTSDTMKNKN